MHNLIPKQEKLALQRRQFMRGVFEAVPEVFEDLRASVFPSYRAALEAQPDITRFEVKLAGVHDWQARWWLTPGWCEREALTTLDFWNVDDENQGINPAVIMGSYVRPIVIPPNFTKRPSFGFGATVGNLQQAETMREELDDYIQRLRAALTLQEPEKDAPRAEQGHDLDPEACRWLALFQCRGLSWREVSDMVLTDPMPSEETIKKRASRGVAQSIGLPLRGSRKSA